MRVSKYFSLKEALYLPSWKRVANQSDGLTVEILHNLKALFSKMDIIRDHFKLPIIVHVAYRPPAYNKLIGGAKSSAHMMGMAVDFHIQGLDCDAVRSEIVKAGLLDKLDMRMEDNKGGNWVHLDHRKPGPSGRIFKP